MIKAVIFDMDGTMVDSEELWHDVTRKMAVRYGIVFDERVRVLMMGRKDSDALAVFKEYFHIEASVDELVRVRKQMIMEDVSLIVAKDGLFELLDLLDHLKIKKAVATSSFNEFTIKTLDSLKIKDRFDVIVTGDEVKVGKPDPEIFLKVAQLLNIPPNDCLVLEDAQNGVEAAYRAGMHIFAIPHEASVAHDFSKATRVLSSMIEVNETALGSLGEGQNA